MSQPSNLQSCLFASESSFGEVSTSFGSRLPVISPVSFEGLGQDMIAVDSVSQHQNDGGHHMRGPQDAATFTIDLYLCGHGTATTGSVTATVIETFLSGCIGTHLVSNDGGTITSTGDADTFTTTNATITPGTLIRVGSLNDAKGNGQFLSVLSQDTNVVELSTAMDGTGATSDVVYAPCNIFPYENPTSGTTPTSFRFLIQTANQRYQMFGCVCTGIDISGLNPGEIPTVSVTMAAARWSVETGSTFPTTTTQLSHVPSPVAAGSCFFQTFGTTTRSKLTVREFALSIEMNTVLLRGPGATDAFQTIVGARRTMCRASCDVTLSAEATGTTTLETIWNTAEGSQVFKHLLYTASAGRDGASLGLYLRKCHMVSSRPVQHDLEGINSQRFSLRSLPDTGRSTDVHKANFILAMG